MVALEAAVRSVEKDGLVWGASKLVAVGFGIKKLQINLVIEDDKIGLDDLQEELAEFDDYVQSSDIVCCTLPITLIQTNKFRLLCKSYKTSLRLVFTFDSRSAHVPEMISRCFWRI